MAYDYQNDPLITALMTMRQGLAADSARRRAARAQATEDVMAGLQARNQQQEEADARGLAQSMTGREGQADRMRSPQAAGASVSGGAGKQVPFGAGDDDEDIDDVPGYNESDLDALADRQEADTMAEPIGNRMSGKATQEAADLQRRQYGSADLVGPGERARATLDEVDADRMAPRAGYRPDTHTPPDAPRAGLDPRAKAQMLTQLDAIGRDPQRDAVLAQISQATQRNMVPTNVPPAVGPGGSAPPPMPSPQARALDAAVAPTIASLAGPPAVMPVMPPQPFGPEQYAAYLASQAPR